MENAKTRVLQKVLPLVDHDNIDITCGVEDIFIAALVSLSRREAKVLHDTLKSDNWFSEAAKAYIWFLTTILGLVWKWEPKWLWLWSVADMELWHYFNNQFVLTKLLLNSFFQILKIVLVVI